MKKENHVIKTHRFRLMPTAAQEEIFWRYEGACWKIWNRGLEYSEARYKNEKKTTGYYTKETGFCALFEKWHKSSDWTFLRELNYETVRYSLKRLSRAYKKGFEDVKKIKRGELRKGTKPGFPKVKKRRMLCSFTMPSGAAAVVGGNLRVPYGNRVKNALLVRMRANKGWIDGDKELGRRGFRLDGKITDVVVKREGENAGGAARWFAYIQCDCGLKPKPQKTADAVGIDANVGNIAWANTAGGDGMIYMPDELRKENRRKRNQRRAARLLKLRLRSIGWNLKKGMGKAARARLGKEFRAPKVKARKAELTAGGVEQETAKRWAEAVLGGRDAEAVNALQEKLMGGGVEEWRAVRMAEVMIPKVSIRHDVFSRRSAKAARQIAGARHDWTHQESRKIANNYGLIAVENIDYKELTKSPKGTVKNPGKNVKQKTAVNRGMQASRHGDFRRKLEYKAEWRGGRFEKIDARFTSQECSECHEIGERDKKTQKFTCRNSECADFGVAKCAQRNAAKNVLQRAAGEKVHGRRAENSPPTRIIPPGAEKSAPGRAGKRQTPIKQTTKKPKPRNKRQDKSD